MSSLNPQDIEILDRFFNRNGYVFDFSTASFDDFTLRSVNIPICEKNNMSKGKSLREFIRLEPDTTVAHLLRDLMNHYENLIILNPDMKRNDDITNRCKAIIDVLSTNNPINTQLASLKKTFNTNYMKKQIEAMQAAIEDHPLDSIGKAKELVESCCKTILESQDTTVDPGWDVPRLTKETFKLLRLTPDDIPDGKRTSDTVKKILGNLSSISTGLAELRNPHGSGHGKSMNYKGLTPRHARLAVGAAATTVQFIWETYLEHKENGLVK